MSQNTTKLPLAKELPNEFCLSLYEGCKKWKAIDWYRALSIRAEMRRALEPTKSNDRQRESLTLLKNPLILPNNHLGDLACSPIMNQTVDEYFDPINLIKNNAKYHDRCEQVHDDEANSELNLWEETKLLRQPAWEMHNELDPEPFFDRRFFISVDLRSPDEFLIKKFKKWVKETRISANIQRKVTKFSQPDFDKWHEDRYLPLLDLEFWSETTKQRISYKMLVEILYKNKDDGDIERIRKTIVGNANDLLSKDYLSALKSQAHTYL